MKYPGSVISRPLLLGLGAVLIVFFIINVSYDIEKKRETEKRREKRKHRQNLDSLLFHPRRNHQGRKSVGNLDWHSGDVIPVFFRKNVKEMKINCEPLFKGSITAQSRARRMKHPRREISPNYWPRSASDSGTTVTTSRVLWPVKKTSFPWPTVSSWKTRSSSLRVYCAPSTGRRTSTAFTSTKIVPRISDRPFKISQAVSRRMYLL